MTDAANMIFLTTRESAVARELNELRDDGDDGMPGVGSQYEHLMLRMGEAAEAYAKANDLGIADYRSLMAGAVRLCQSLRYACDYKREGKTERFTVWSHKPIAFNNLRLIQAPDIDKSSLEECVGEYLSLPYRSEMMDRLLVDALVGVEVRMFAHQMFGQPTVFFLPAPSVMMQKHVLVTWFLSNLFGIVIFGGLAALFFYLGFEGKISEGWGNGIGLALCALVAISFLWSTLSLPFAWRNQRKAKLHLAGLMDQMGTLYNELGSSGPVSANRIYELASKASADGVVWPSPLFPLLEDIKSRSGRF